MTFTFTMDAFPGYTKFEPTKKVLAIMQVVTEAEDEVEEDRASCTHPFDQAVTAGTGVTAKAEIVSDTNGVATIKVSGTDVAPAFDTDTFGSYSGNAVEMIVNFPIDATGTYTITQTNPALAYYVGRDDYVSLVDGSYVKTKDYSFTKGENPEYSFLVSDEVGDITIELKNKNTGKIVKTYNVDSSELTFA